MGKKYTQTKFSVIIPVYNVEKYIKKCLKSVLNQSEKDFELILVDDGSTDSSGLICNKYKEKDDRIKVIHTENNGLMSAWMRGVKEAQTDYIVFVDSDDWIASGMFEKMWEAVERKAPDLVSCNFVKVEFKQKIRCKYSVAAGDYDQYQIKKNIYPVMLNNGDFQGRGINISRCAKMIKKSIIIDNLKYCNMNIQYGEDLNIIFPILLDCKKIIILDSEDCDYYYRMNPSSILHSYDNTMYTQVRTLYSILNKVCKEKENIQFERQLMADYIAAIVQSYKNELMNPDGYRNIVSNIERFTQDDYFLLSCKEICWKHYRKLNTIIIWSICNWNFFSKYIIIWVLRIFKMYKVMRLDNITKFYEENDEI